MSNLWFGSVLGLGLRSELGSGFDVVLVSLMYNSLMKDKKGGHFGGFYSPE